MVTDSLEKQKQLLLDYTKEFHKLTNEVKEITRTRLDQKNTKDFLIKVCETLDNTLESRIDHILDQDNIRDAADHLRD